METYENLNEAAEHISKALGEIGLRAEVVEDERIQITLAGEVYCKLTNAESNAWYDHATATPEWALLEDADRRVKYLELALQGGAEVTLDEYRDAKVSQEKARRVFREMAKRWLAAVRPCDLRKAD